METQSLQNERFSICLRDERRSQVSLEKLERAEVAWGKKKSLAILMPHFWLDFFQVVYAQCK